MTVKYLPLMSGVGKLPGGGFSGKGDWNIYKCFYEEDGKYGEFFLNINQSEGTMEFSAKDPWYQTVLTKAFFEAMDF